MHAVGTGSGAHSGQHAPGDICWWKPLLHKKGAHDPQLLGTHAEQQAPVTVTGFIPAAQLGHGAMQLEAPPCALAPAEGVPLLE
jgi:hypothetical protein